jgi:hypothetical protein
MAIAREYGLRVRVLRTRPGMTPKRNLRRDRIISNVEGGRGEL